MSRMTDGANARFEFSRPGFRSPRPIRLFFKIACSVACSGSFLSWLSAGIGRWFIGYGLLFTVSSLREANRDMCGLDLPTRSGIHGTYFARRNRRRGEETCLTADSDRGEAWVVLGGSDPALLSPVWTTHGFDQLDIFVYPYPRHHRFSRLVILLHHDTQPDR